MRYVGNGQGAVGVAVVVVGSSVLEVVVPDGSVLEVVVPDGSVLEVGSVDEVELPVADGSGLVDVVVAPLVLDGSELDVSVGVDVELVSTLVAEGSVVAPVGSVGVAVDGAMRRLNTSIIGTKRRRRIIDAPVQNSAGNEPLHPDDAPGQTHWFSVIY